MLCMFNLPVSNKIRNRLQPGTGIATPVLVHTSMGFSLQGIVSLAGVSVTERFEANSLSPIDPAMKRSPKVEPGRGQGVQAFMRSAEDYATAAVGPILGEIGERPGRLRRLFHDYSRLVTSLEVHFLFPNLRASDRQVLVRLLATQNKVRMRQRAPMPAQKSARTSTPGAARWERQLRHLRTEALHIGRKSPLTPLQQAAFQQLLFDFSSTRPAAS